ncbi:MAG: TadE/TadG family type IV pilus assembly protein [Vulcanimicrobiaceae bacterium]
MIARLLHCERGQSILEVAVAAPFLLLILAGCIDFGRYAYEGIVLANGAHAGVQYGSLSPINAADLAGMESAAQADMPGLSVAFSPTPSTYCECADGAASTCAPTDCPASHSLRYVSVTVAANFQPFIHLPSLPSTMTISRTAVQEVSP